MTLLLREYFPKASLSAIDHKDIHFEKLTNFEIAAYRLNIEKDKLPFADGELDFVIANQVLEHIKEIFWINHEVFRVLKPGGSSLLVYQMALLFITVFWEILDFIQLVTSLFLLTFEFFQREIFIFFINLLERTFVKYRDLRIAILSFSKKFAGFFQHCSQIFPPQFSSW